ncbi:glycosyltransferase family 2 protein [Paenibacillus silvae]|uniref:Glycosyltransferase 2-like domain-containing protein n=1 Tax=Paenibacillus silvae TaxID=1325358 RepID=A0A2W6NM55_9BACL|nr:glycosyltransferase family 2 protein [Paenibacillus silvae]PZT56957.1 hypothetical protein DN757_04780 [Paenibacillus silvae]
MKEKTPLVSIIVPMFNTEEFIEESLESIIGQTYKNIEVILIDDCSFDRTYEIALQYSLTYRNILLIKQETNKGVSSARNAGLRAAKGDYVFFLDSDDTLPLEAIEKMCNAAVEHNADIVTGLYERFDKSSSSISNIFNIYPELKTEGELNVYKVPAILYSVYTCGKLFKMSVVEQMNFTETLKYGEDQAFTIECLLKTKKIYNLSSIVYNYRFREGNTESSSQSVYKNPVENFEYLRKMFTLVQNLFAEYVSNPQTRIELLSVYLSRVLHWNIWTALSNGLLSMNMYVRFNILSVYLSWLTELDKNLHKSNEVDFHIINRKIGRIASVLDQRTQDLYSRHLLTP